MKIRTYYWRDRVISGPEFLARRLLHRAAYNHFRVGNAGDILAPELIEKHYGMPSINDKGAGHRLLLVGSIAHSMLPGDILCGVGVKTREVPSASEAPVRVWALRGPISRDVLEAAGHDVSGIKFLLDPGLKMRFEMEEAAQRATPHGAIFIPHYREREKYLHSLPKGIRFVNIDDSPANVGRAILSAELVYTSSLHGIIFAHALRRPCVLVSPQTHEPMLKYEDYYASVNLPLPRALSDIWQADLATAPNSPAEIHYENSDFVLPDLALLRSSGIAVP
jgi:pyruvyltransferase